MLALLGVRGVASLATAILLASVAGCSCSPEVIACPAVGYSTDDLEECGCGPVMPDGLVTAVIAGPGSFEGGRSAQVFLHGRLVATGTSAADGSLAILVTVAGTGLGPPDLSPDARGVDLDVVVNRTHVVVRVPPFETAVVTPADLELVLEEPDVLQFAGTVRAIAWTNCSLPLTPTPQPVRAYAANLTSGQASVTPVGALDVPFSVDVPGFDGDIAVVAVRHESGGVSGCFYSEDVCCDCPGGIGGGRRSPFRRARCSPRLRESGRCRMRDAGIEPEADAGVDADTSHDASHDASSDTDSPPRDVGPLPEGGPS